MSSAGQIVGGIAGGVIGFIVGGPAGALQGAALGAGVGGYIDPPKAPNLRGPTLDDKTFQSSAYGVSIASLYGMIGTMGNIIYLENNEYKAVTKKESQGAKGGGGGATYETTTYLATFAVALGEAVPGARALRVWAGGKIIYQIKVGTRTMYEMITEGGGGSEYSITQYQFYDGTQTEPDSRMESVLGVGNCPSYEGTCYIMFYDFDLTDFGNGLAGCPIKVEIGNPEFEDDFRIVGHYKIAFSGGWNAGASTLRPMINARTLRANDAQNSKGVFTGTIDIAEPPSERFSVSNASVPIFDNLTGVCNTVSSAVSYEYVSDEGVRFVGALIDGAEYRNGYTRFPTQISGAYVTIYRVYQKPLSGALMFLGAASPVLPVGVPGSITASGWYLSLFDSQTPLIDFGTVSSDPGCIIIGEDKCVRISAGSPTTVYVYNYSGTLLKQFDISLVYGFEGGRGFHRPGLFSGENEVIFLLSGILRTAIGQFDFVIINLDDETVRNVQVLGEGTATTSGYDYPSISLIENILCVGQNIGIDEYGFWLMDTMYFGEGGGGALLQDIVDEWLVRSGIGPSNFDTSALAGKRVQGYRVSDPTSARGALDQLMAAYLFDFVETGYKIRAVNRGADSIATISHSDFVLSGDGQRYKKSTDRSALMPSRYTVNYLDPNREYDASSEYADYPTENFGGVSVNLAVVMDADLAAKSADIFLKTLWNESSKFEFNLPQAYLHLRPGDVIDAEFVKGVEIKVRIEDLSVSAEQVLSVGARATEEFTYQSDATGSPPPIGPSTPIFSTDTDMILMDLPLLSDSLDYAGFLVGAVGSDRGWAGSVLHRSINSGQSYSPIDRFGGNTTAGVAGSSLAANDGFVIDESAALVVWPSIGQFESVIYDEMMAGKNFIAYGADGRWEICQYQNATPMLDGSIVLSTFVRCLGGTEWASGLHAAGDYVVYLADPDNRFVGMNNGALSVDYFYKMVTVGQSVADADAQSFAYRGVNLTPLSPANLSTSRASNNWVFNFVERTRYSESFWYSGILPRREFPGGFEMDIYKAGFIVRTLTSVINQFNYTAAQQIEDFGSVQSTITAKIYQLNEYVGRGYALEVNA